MTTKNQPTQAELQILQVLWDLGEVTVREVHEKLSEKHTSGYTTVLKIMQIMHEKGYLKRDESSRAHVYSAKISQSETQGQIVKDLVSRVFRGSTSQMLVSALNGKTSKKELAEIKAVLKKLEKNSK